MVQMKKLVLPLSDLPSPSSITVMWNFGSLLGVFLTVQIVSGLILSMGFIQSELEAFNSVSHIMRDIDSGWIIRLCHSNTASFFFMGLMWHLARGMFFNSAKSKNVTWFTGCSILLISMATAFFGYVLPWGQMSYWGATVITNILSAVPYLGPMLVEWLWGNFSVSQPTLNRFFSIHFVLPFVMILMVLVHIFSLHEKGSSNPLGSAESTDKIEFHKKFTNKDIVYILLTLFFLFFLISNSPNIFMDTENMNEANPMKAPTHIQPEWYFLFAYAILRSIPSKLGGIAAMVSSILLLFSLSLKNPSISSVKFSPWGKIKTLMFILSFLLLTFIGMKPVEEPYTLVGKLSSFMYFTFFVS